MRAVIVIPFGKFTIMTALLCWSSLAFARYPENSDGVDVALAQIRNSALASQPDKAAALFAEDLVLISQSGKLYGKESALLDLSNGFTAWENSEVVVRAQGDTAIVTLVNRRTRAGMEPAQFLVMQVWRNDRGKWVMFAQSSTAIKTQAPEAK